MGGGPFGPWSSVKDLPEGTKPPARGALAGTAFDLFAQIYEKCLEVSPALTPPVLDEMELWEVAVMLGKAQPTVAAEPAAQEPSHNDAAVRRYEAIRRRRAGLPEEPEPELERPAPLDPALVTLIPT